METSRANYTTKSDYYLMKFHWFAILLFTFSLPSAVFSQGKTVLPDCNIPDTILMDDGKVIITHITDTVGFSVEMIRPHSHRHKKMEVDKDYIFQMSFGCSGKKVPVYFYDSLIGNDLTVDEAYRFIQGEQDAQRGFHAFGTSAAAFIVGTISGTVGSFFALAPPFAFAGFMSYRYVKIRHHSVKNVDNVHHDGYLYGYSMVARRKRTSKALLWGGIGVVVGTVFHYIYINN
jgi:hypothetical protein